MSRNRLACLAVSMLTAGIWCGSALAVDLFNTSFESPEYTLGQLTGQHGWIAYRNGNPDAIQVSTAGAFSGPNGVKIDGALMDLYPAGQYRGYYYPPINYDPVAGGNPVVEYSVDVAFHNTDPTLAVSWHTEFYTSIATGEFRLGIVGIQTDGTGLVDAFLYSDLDPNAMLVPYTSGQWIHMVTQFNWTTGMMSLSIDGTPVGSLPFETAGADFGDADLAMICASPFTSFTYIDNYRIQATGGGSPPCPGDVDGDRDVDLSDLSTLLANFGNSGGTFPGDLDADGDVDLSDLSLMLANFGAVCPP